MCNCHKHPFTPGATPSPAPAPIRSSAKPPTSPSGQSAKVN